MELRQRYPLKDLLKLSGIARSTYYYYLKQQDKDKYAAEKPFEKLTTDVTEFKVCNDKVYLSPVLDLFNREVISYSISLSPNLQQIRDMLTDLFAKLPDTARPIFHSDQGWQYQHAEYQRLLAEHNTT